MRSGCFRRSRRSLIGNGAAKGKGPGERVPPRSSPEWDAAVAATRTAPNGVLRLMVGLVGWDLKPGNVYQRYDRRVHAFNHSVRGTNLKLDIAEEGAKTRRNAGPSRSASQHFC
jgi:hypothetical protein